MEHNGYDKTCFRFHTGVSKLCWVLKVYRKVKKTVLSPMSTARHLLMLSAPEAGSGISLTRDISDLKDL